MTPTICLVSFFCARRIFLHLSFIFHPFVIPLALKLDELKGLRVMHLNDHTQC